MASWYTTPSLQKKHTWELSVKENSLTVLDNAEDLQAMVTRNAFLFAQLTREVAKKESLTREQVIKEGTIK